MTTTFTIPADELPLVEANLDKCPELRLLGTNGFTLSERSYIDLFLDVQQPEALYRLGDLVGRAVEQRDALRLAFPEQLTEPLAWVLGRPNFWCGPLAHLFQAAGHDIPCTAEDEQAFILHWLTKLVLQYGEQWRDHAQRELDALKQSLTPSLPQHG